MRIDGRRYGEANRRIFATFSLGMHFGKVVQALKINITEWTRNKNRNITKEK
jgi:hypothetical protein